MWVNLSLLILIPFADIYSVKLQFRSIQSLSCVQLFATPWTVAPQASLSITNSQSLLKIMSIKSVMPSNHLLLYYPLLIPPSIFPSIIVFSSESVLQIRWPKLEFQLKSHSELVTRPDIQTSDTVDERPCSCHSALWKALPQLSRIYSTPITWNVGWL